MTEPHDGRATWSGVGVVRLLISFDIDGTLENGSPPGPVTRSFIDRLKARGAVIGSCSDRTILEQRTVWEQLKLSPDFVARKTELPLVRKQFSGYSYVHIGDTTVDEMYAEQAQFAFYWSWDVPLADADRWVELLTPTEYSRPHRSPVESVLGGRREPNVREQLSKRVNGNALAEGRIDAIE